MESFLSAPDYYDYNYEEEPNHLVEFCLLGAVKIFATSFLSPFEVSKILLQCQQKKSLTESLQTKPNKLPENQPDTGSNPASENLFFNGQWKAITFLNQSLGFSSLWRGNLSACVHSILSATVEDSIYNSIVAKVDLVDDFEGSCFVQHPHYKTLIASMCFSHGIAGVLASPLEVIQTRLIVQAAHLVKYHNTWDAVKTIVKEESLSGLFPNPFLSFSFYFMSAFFSEASDGILQTILRIDPLQQRFLYALGDFSFCMFGLLFRLPFMTCRRRLMLQPATSRAMKTLVLTNSPQLPYEGFLDCLSRIIAEEGVSTLYRGFKFHLYYNSILFSIYYLIGADLPA